MSKLTDAFKRIMNRSGFTTDSLGKTLTYNVNEGASKSCVYIENSHESDEIDETDGLYNVKRLSVVIPSDATLGVVSPDVRDTVTIDSAQWAIQSFTSDFVSSHTLHLERRELLKKYRR